MSNKITELPTKPWVPEYNIEKERILIHGAPGVGKTVLAASFPNAIVAACEPGFRKIECYAQVIDEWPDFFYFTKLLAAGNHQFKTLVIDGVDSLFLKCRKYNFKRLGITHESDSEWGKGWDIVRNDFKERLMILETLDMGVVFTCHSEMVEVKANTRTGSTHTLFDPLINKGAKGTVLGWVDHILFFNIENDASGDNHRVIHAEQSQNFTTKSHGGRPPFNYTSLFTGKIEMFFDKLKENYDSNVAKLKENNNGAV